jgi:hypothetical protein
VGAIVGAGGVKTVNHGTQLVPAGYIACGDGGQLAKVHFNVTNGIVVNGFVQCLDGGSEVGVQTSGSVEDHNGCIVSGLQGFFFIVVGVVNPILGFAMVAL